MYIGPQATEEQMTTYKVISDMMVNHQPGDSVSDDALKGINIEALVAAGHLEPTKTSKKESE